MSCFQDAIAGAMTTLQEVAGVSVTYHRAAAWFKVVAVPGQTSFNLSDEYGVTTKYQSRDYIIPADALKLAGQRITPQRGDYIQETIRGTPTRYEVSRPDGGEQLWKYSDHGRTRIRIHTKLAPGESE